MRPDACRPSPENGKTVKRQRRLNEIFAPATNKGEPEKHQTNEPRDSKLVLPLKKQTKRDDITHSSWVCNSFGAKQGQRSGVSQCQEATRRCAECSSIMVNRKMQDRCVRCKIPTYCGNQCKERHWAKKHHRECEPNPTGCPACGEDIVSEEGANITCERGQGVRYCSQQCLNRDFNKHIPRCPMTLPSLMVTETQASPTSGEGRAQMPTLLQPGGVRDQRSILIDTEEVIAKVKNVRWRLSRKPQAEKESDEQNAESAKKLEIKFSSGAHSTTSDQAWKPGKQRRQAQRPSRSFCKQLWAIMTLYAPGR